MTKTFVAVLQRCWRFFCHEWLWLGIVTLCVSGVVLFTLFGTNQHYHAVWMYTPYAIPTLSFVDAILSHQVVRAPSNHATWLGVWTMQHVFTTPASLVMVLYLGATLLTSLAAYLLFRVRHISVTWAIVGAVVFGLLPARFDMHNLATHWWMTLPVVLWWGLSWWDGTYLQPARLSAPAWLFVGVTGLVLGVFGFTMWLWSSIVLLISAVLAGFTYRTWRPVWLALGMGGVAWSIWLLLNQVWPIPSLDGDAGVRLSALWIPSADHRIAWLAQRGLDFDTLDIVHTDVAYIGIFACIGLGIMVIQTLIRSVGASQVTAIHRMIVVIGVLIIIANQRGLMLFVQFFGGPVFSTMFVDVWVAFLGITAFVWMLNALQLQQKVLWAMVISLCALVDQVPQTNMLYQMMQRQVIIPTPHTWRDGIWFGQAQQAPDVVSITGVSATEQGYGRWSDAAKAEYIEITLAQPITGAVTLEIRARGVGVNVGTPVVVQIGRAQQSMVLTDVVTPYQLSFADTGGNTIRVYPHPVTDPPAGDVRLIGVLVQSIRVIDPYTQRVLEE